MHSATCSVNFDDSISTAWALLLISLIYVQVYVQYFQFCSSVLALSTCAVGTRTSIIWTAPVTIQLGYIIFVTGVCSIRVVQQNSMGIIYLNKNLNIFMIQLAHMHLDSGVYATSMWVCDEALLCSSRWRLSLSGQSALR